MQSDHIREQFLNWVGAAKVSTDSQPPDRYSLYRNFLSSEKEAETFWAQLATHARHLDNRRRQQLPWLFMAAIQFLVFENPDEPISWPRRHSITILHQQARKPETRSSTLFGTERMKFGT
jgi:hypothetical protein